MAKSTKSVTPTPKLEQTPNLAAEAENAATFAETERAAEQAAAHAPEAPLATQLETLEAVAAQTHKETAAPSDAPEADAEVPTMKIDVRITATRNNFGDPTRALATVVLDGCFEIEGVRVVKGENSLFCSMPARKLASGEYSVVCNPITTEFGVKMNAAVLGAYQRHLEQQMDESVQTPHIYDRRAVRVAMSAAPENVSENTPEVSAPNVKVDVRITSTRNNPGDPTRALATVVLNDCFAVKGLHVVRGEDGMYCAMPARRLGNGEYRTICNPTTPEFGVVLSASVLSEYQVHLQEQMNESEQTPHNVEAEYTEPFESFGLEQ